MNLITQSDAAKIAGITKQGIGSIKKKGTYNFFVKNDKGRIRVDIDSDQWKKYIIDRDNSTADNIKIEIPKEPKRIELGNKEADDKAVSTDGESVKQKFYLTAGFDPSTFAAETPTQLKALVETVNKQLDMKIKLGEYIPRQMVINILDVMSQNIQSHFIDLSRRVSGRLCKSLDKVGFEKDVEKIIGPMVEKGIQDIKIEVKKALRLKYDS